MKFSKFIKKNKVKIGYSIVLFIIFFTFVSIAAANVAIKKIIPNSDINLSPINFVPDDYPKLENNFVPFISAQGAIVLDKDSQITLFEKNSNLRFSPASTTKIMTALVALEHYNLDDLLTVKDSQVEGSVINLSQGEKLSFEDLLYAMMLPSANDATLVIADNYPGGRKAFVEKMNIKAKELGLNNTFFADPVGLLDERDYTSPLDLARLGGIALQNSEFAKVVSTKNKVIKNSDGKNYYLDNLNILLNYPGVNGIKTGFTQEAGQVLVTSKKVPGTDKEVIIVVMQSLDRFGDSQAILNFLENNITYQSIHP